MVFTSDQGPARNTLNTLKANQVGDTYTLTTVLFAAVLFFGGVASKLERQLARSLALAAALIFVIVGVLTLANLPVELGDELFFLG